MRYTRFRDIPEFTRASYQVDYGIDTLQSWVDHAVARGLDLNPDFQRGHVWTQSQQTSFVEFILRGGESARHIYFNFPYFELGYSVEEVAKKTGKRMDNLFVIVDGLQRLTAITGFVKDQVPAFGSLYSEYTDRLRMTGALVRLHVNSLKTRAEVLQWYIDINSGGTPHSPAEILRVRHLMAQEDGY